MYDGRVRLPGDERHFADCCTHMVFSLDRVEHISLGEFVHRDHLGLVHFCNMQNLSNYVKAYITMEKSESIDEYEEHRMKTQPWL